MFSYKSCRDELLETVRYIVRKKGVNQFTIDEVIRVMQDNNTAYAENTIRTHICSRCCVNASANHMVRYDDYERIGQGLYKLL